MQKKHILIFFIFILNCCLAQKRKTINILFDTNLNQTNLSKFQILSNGDSIQIEEFKFYISDVLFLYNDSLLWAEKNSFHLIDFFEKETQMVSLKIPEHTLTNKIKFNLGIDSITSVSGALAGDLDPSKGMYWAWQSGYINLKLEGTKSNCPTRKNKFQFHIGGYKQPFYAIQSVTLKTKEITNNLNIKINLSTLFKNINFQKTHTVMIPSKEAVEFAKEISSLFYIDEK